MTDKTNVVFVGFMGTGKSSAGRMLARKLKKTLWDVDQLIENKEKRTIRQIFETEGEAYFRRVEKEAIQTIAREDNVVITTGGGAVLDSENLRVLSEKGWIVALHASPETIFKRVKNSKKRPLLLGSDRMAEIRRLLEIRRPLYAKADFSIDTDGKNTAQVIQMILRAIKEK